MSTLLTFKQFLDDEEAADMYVTGVAGTGKTTDLSHSVQHCIDLEIPYVVCAYTHKACGILRSKLPPGARVQTLHSFLGKRPTINVDAIKLEHVNNSSKVAGTDEEPKVLFVDEYSMVGDKDMSDITVAQEGEDGDVKLKVVWLGDSHQLPPVGDTQAIVPYGDHQVLLTKQYRNDNPLQGPLKALISYIEKTATPSPLEPVTGFFERGIDIISGFNSCDQDKVMLAFTNRRVQSLNQAVAGKIDADDGDEVFSPTTQGTYTLLSYLPGPEVDYVDRHYADPVHLGTKFKTLEHLVRSENCEFAMLEDAEGQIWQYAVVFGHYEYKLVKERLEQAAVETNQAIEKKFPGKKASQWAKQNYTTALAKRRSKAWRDYLGFKDCVICIDFPYAMTVHKSQGSTYNTVFIDTDDIAVCSNSNFTLYLKLLYVAISRASTRVYTS